VNSFQRLLAAAVAVIVTVGMLHVVFPAASAYQGVVTVAPGVGGDSILELGNAGRDIAGTGDIFIRPGSLSGSTANFARFYSAASKAYLTVPGVLTAGYLTVSPQNTVSEDFIPRLVP